MRRLALASAVLLAAGSASAGVLTMATWSQVTQGVPMTRTLAQLNASGVSTGGAISVSLSYPQTTISVFRPKTANGVLDLHIRITQGGMQALTATPSGANATAAVPGSVVVMTAQHVAMGVDQSMLVPGINTLLQVPLRHGQAGVFTDQFTILGQAHSLTIFHYAWTPRSLFFEYLSLGGQPLPPVLAEGSFNVTSGGPGWGTVTLVAPTLLAVRGPLASQTTVSVTRLTLTFPEPGAWLLLAAAGAALAFAGARESR